MFEQHKAALVHDDDFHEEVSWLPVFPRIFFYREQPPRINAVENEQLLHQAVFCSSLPPSLSLSLSLSVSLFLFFFLSTYVILKTKPSPFHLFVFHLWHREGGLRWPRTCVNVATSMSSNVHAIWHWHYRRNNCFPFGLPPPLAPRKREELWKGGWNKRLVEMVWFLDTRNPLFRRISPFRLPIDWHLKFIFKFVTKIRL